MHCSATDITVANASKAPAAPIMWPVIDFVPLIASEWRAPAARSPKTVQIASASRWSPSGVEVPCGLIRSTSSAGTPRRSSAIRIVRAEPAPASTGWAQSHPAGPAPPRRDHAPPVARRAVADHLGVDPRTACLGRVEVLEEERARALAEHEPV